MFMLFLHFLFPMEMHSSNSLERQRRRENGGSGKEGREEGNSFQYCNNNGRLHIFQNLKRRNQKRVLMSKYLSE